MASNNATLCARCGRDYAADMPKPGASGASGYAVRPNGERICYDCSAADERAAMIETGRATLYVTGGVPRKYGYTSRGFRYRVHAHDDLAVQDWPGRLKFKAREYATSRHNIGGRRLDVWFSGPDGFVWHGVNIGDSEILRSRRTQERA